MEQASNLGRGEQVRVDGLMERGKYVVIRHKALGIGALAIETEVADHPETSAPDAGLEMALGGTPGRKGLGG